MTDLLANIRVLDLARTIAAPTAAQMLGDFGAEVIKVERPGAGDETRAMGPTFLQDQAGQATAEGSLYLSVNRNKKGITTDLSTPGGQDIVRKLAAVSDILIENYKTGDLAKYKLDYASLHAVNPRLIYCSITGYGQTGPYKSRPGYDPIFQAMAGWMSVNGDPAPMIVASNQADAVSGYHAVMAVLAALYHRDHGGGVGQHIDISLLDVAVSAYGTRALDFLLTGSQPPRRGTYGIVLPCADGEMLIPIANPAQWARFCDVLGLPELATDPRYLHTHGRAKHATTLYPQVEGATRTLGRQELAAALEAAGVPFGAVNSYQQVFADPQVRERGLKIEVPHPLAGTIPLVANPIKFSDTPIDRYQAPPLLGQHTEEVLKTLLGFDDAAIAQLRRDGAI